MKIDTIEEIHKEYERYPDREGEKFIRVRNLKELIFKWEQQGRYEYNMIELLKEEIGDVAQDE